MATGRYIKTDLQLEPETALSHQMPSLSQYTPPATLAEAREALLERMLVAKPITGDRVLEGLAVPQPSTHIDPRMHLTLHDMRACYNPSYQVKREISQLVVGRTHPTQEQTEARELQQQKGSLPP